MEGAALREVTEGLGVALSLQSFAARALLGSIIAALVAAIAARMGWVRSGRARRTLVLAPVAAAVGAAFACTAPGSTFLPALVVTADTGQALEIFGAEFTVRRLEWLLVAYVAVASFLLLRRGGAHWAVHRQLRGAVACEDRVVLAGVRRLSSKLGMAAPPLLLLPDCPGGAFTAGLRAPVVAVDPALLDRLDGRELEGLIAHELAHIARRDVALNAAVGAIRDLTFFVPPLTVAARWLRQEQEHSADDLASEATGRPAALASSILKVWEGSRRQGAGHHTAMACATMTPALALPGAPGVPAQRLRGGARQIAERVVRLIDRGAPLTVRRQRVEMVLAMGAAVLATAVTVVLPSQVDAELLLAQWSRPPERPVESPAMAVMRAAAPQAPVVATGSVAAVTAAPCADCLLLESGAEWRAQSLPRAPDRAPGWQSGSRIWQAAPDGMPTPPSARTLWGVDSRSGRLGFFLVAGDS